MSLPVSLSTTLGGISQLPVWLKCQGREQPPFCLSLVLGAKLCPPSAWEGGEGSEGQCAVWYDKAACGYFLACPSCLPVPPQELPVRRSQGPRTEMRAISGGPYCLTFTTLRYGLITSEGTLTEVRGVGVGSAAHS